MKAIGRSFMLLMVIAVVSGCTAWPNYGKGGMAEHHLQSLESADNNRPNDGNSPSLAMEHDILARHLDVLVLEGAELCFPATVVQARQRQNRIARGLAGGLTADAQNDMVLQRRLLSRLERQLDYVTGQAICTLPSSLAQQTPGEVAEKIDNLLNADNQFAFDSSEINPKYLGRLADAASILRDHGGYRLHIAGHTDSIGDAEHNRALSLARAEQVSRYLQIFGLAAERIKVSAVGADHPLIPGVEPQVRLTNRRVSVELIEAGTNMDKRRGMNP